MLKHLLFTSLILLASSAVFAQARVFKVTLPFSQKSWQKGYNTDVYANPLYGQYNNRQPSIAAPPLLPLAYTVCPKMRETDGGLLSSERINKMPYINIEDIVSLTTNGYQQRLGGPVQLGGAR